MASTEVHLSFHNDVPRIVEGRTSADVDDVVGLQQEALFTVNDKPFLQAERVGLGNLHRRHHGLGILYAA